MFPLCECSLLGSPLYTVLKRDLFCFRRVLHEFERTISEFSSERERERVCHEIEKERLMRERDQAIEDLKNVERSFSDTYK